jgi:hypothetical protein
MALPLHGLENTRHKGRKELKKPYESGGKLTPPAPKPLKQTKSKSKSKSVRYDPCDGWWELS